MTDDDAPRQRSAWRDRLHDVMFESNTRAAQIFDVALIALILASVAAVTLESVQTVNSRYGRELRILEWFFTIAFTIEYVLRLISTRHPVGYATSFFGVVDFLAIVPTYISILVPEAQFLLVVRLLRVLRVFRILKLVAYLGEANFLLRALRQSRKKITVFLFGVMTLVVIFGTLMYLVEGPENGFTSIPRAMYWAIVTLTTVGFGNISPQTNLGQTLAGLLMIVGYGVIAVPTGIVTSEMMNGDGDSGTADAKRKAHLDAARDTGREMDPEDQAVPDPGPADTRSCPACDLSGHDDDAVFCKRCGTRLEEKTADRERRAADA